MTKILFSDIRNYYQFSKDDNNFSSSNKILQCNSEEDTLRSSNKSSENLSSASIELIFANNNNNLSITSPNILPPISNILPTASPVVDYQITSEYPLANRFCGNSEFSYGSTLASHRRQRGEKRPIPQEQKDEKYFERRKRNNEAAKKSRDARKMREDRIAFRAALLEQENAILRAQLIAIREENAILRAHK